MVKNSALTNELANVTRQLKSGKTRGSNPRDLDLEKISALEQKRDALKSRMRKVATERNIARINDHTSACADRVILEMSNTISTATERSEAYFQAVGGAGSSGDLRAQAAAIRARATEKAKEERKAVAEKAQAEKKAEREAKRRTCASDEQRSKRMRTSTLQSAVVAPRRKTIPPPRVIL